jgi:hypothetical protein
MKRQDVLLKAMVGRIRADTMIFSRLVTARYERFSIILTSKQEPMRHSLRESFKDEVPLDPAAFLPRRGLHLRHPAKMP